METNCKKQSGQFFTTDEAKRIADNVLAFQRTTGGWPKNIPIHRPLGGELPIVLGDKDRRNDSTTDNDATILELTYLARLYQQSPEERYKEAFLKRSGVYPKRTV